MSLIDKAKEIISYRGGPGMFSYVLHRITGVGIFLFLLAHILDTVVIGWGPDVYNKVVKFYHHPVLRVGEVILAACLLFHAFNGIRIIIIDFYEEATVFHKKLFYGVLAAFVICFLPLAFVMLKPLWEGH